MLEVHWSLGRAPYGFSLESQSILILVVHLVILLYITGCLNIRTGSAITQRAASLDSSHTPHSFSDWWRLSQPPLIFPCSCFLHHPSHLLPLFLKMMWVMIILWIHFCNHDDSLLSHYYVKYVFFIYNLFFDVNLLVDWILGSSICL